MTECNEQQFKRVARALDGQAVDLTPAERELADEILRMDSDLSGALQTPIGPKAAERARRRLAAALAGGNMWKHVRVAFLSGVSAAAMIIIAMGLANLMVTGSVLPDDAVSMQIWERWVMPKQKAATEMLANDLAELDAVQSTLVEMWEEDPDYEAREFWRLWGEESTAPSESRRTSAGRLRAV
ncbi:MAG: hypothetical protein QF577_02020 [Phycisphaerae bacterium]|jgi:hypothetical protein|nr:hypothetical protein [Phycisphaerae bacterium]